VFHVKHASREDIEMARERKYAGGITVSDLAVKCQQLLQWHDLHVELSLERCGLNDNGIRVRCELWEGKTFLGTDEPLVVQYGGISLKGEGQWGQMMLLLHAAVSTYEENAWYWTERTRRRAVPTQADSTPL
jgi:hypothetical protein